MSTTSFAPDVFYSTPRASHHLDILGGTANPPYQRVSVEKILEQLYTKIVQWRHFPKLEQQLKPNQQYEFEFAVVHSDSSEQPEQMIQFKEIQDRLINRFGLHQQRPAALARLQQLEQLALTVLGQVRPDDLERLRLDVLVAAADQLAECPIRRDDPAVFPAVFRDGLEQLRRPAAFFRLPVGVL